MSSQQPSRYENYPPERDVAPGEDSPGDGVRPPAPVVRPYVPEPLAPPVPSGLGRRGVVWLAIGVPLAGFFGVGMFASPEREVWLGPDDLPSMYATADFTDEGGPTGTDVTVAGRYSTTIPDGWELVEDGGSGIEVNSGANRLSASGIEVPPSTLATDAIALLARGQRRGFTGELDEPVDDSTAQVQRATLSGAGKFRGKSARLLAELWIDDTGGGLLTTSILTAKPDSGVTAEAEQMVAQLSGTF